MRKCTGGDTQQWGFEAIFNVQCPQCGTPVEFFKDEIERTCGQCNTTVLNDRRDFGCARNCSADDPHMRNKCSKFVRSKKRFYGHLA